MKKWIDTQLETKEKALRSLCFLCLLMAMGGFLLVVAGVFIDGK